jgi:hypothetical protein
MEKFASIELKLNKSVKKGDEESLLSLFSSEDRLKRMEVLTNMDEGNSVKVVLEGLGETNLILGNDMEKGQKKTIMTLFWLPEKSKPIKMQRNAEAGENITVTMWK